MASLPAQSKSPGPSKSAEGWPSHGLDWRRSDPWSSSKRYCVGGFHWNAEGASPLVPIPWPTDPERLAQVDLLHPILAYSIMRPFRSNRLKQYVPDVLDREALARSLKSVTRRMSARLQQTQDHLRETGHAEDAKRCVPKKPARILEDMGRMPKNFASLVACESHVLDEMLRLAAVGRTLARQYTGHPPHQFKNLWREGLEFARMLELRLRRGAANGYLTKLASLVLIEATRALAQAPRARRALDGHARPSASRYRLRVGGNTENRPGHPVKFCEFGRSRPTRVVWETSLSLF